ncbi:hypothetical protein [Kitasatospora purpeofusca]|uniref:hypothetical protein n=1 Tax=Kitasatospora purpeofusca TaxID=67352 RepID=UPI002255A684|nr:hypothetical protein [Kitasatospora purpeofusca]MCX4755209.1 hypothetical protein [Kitasatospora purpeofusca]WSR36907.1 hypothetical protein OG715_41625 [Kitasatospora purpeofusca]
MTTAAPHPGRLPYPFDRAHCLSPMPHNGLLTLPGPARITLPSGDPAHLAVRHADVLRVLTDRRLSRRAMLTAPGGPRWTLADRDPPGPHLAFGHGTHRCIGADLALLELRTAIGALADRGPHLRLAEPATALPFLGGSLIGLVERLPVRTHAP